jgi:hypothetical protein
MLKYMLTVLQRQSQSVSIRWGESVSIRWGETETIGMAADG